MNKYRIEIITNINDDFIADWEKLWETSQNKQPFNSPHWVLAYMKTNSDENLKIYAGYKNGKLFCTLPLVYKRLFGVPTLISPGGRFLDKTTLLYKKYDQKMIDQLLAKTGQFNMCLAEVDQSIIDNFKPKSKIKYFTQQPLLNLYIPKVVSFLSYVNKGTLRNLLNKQNKNKDNIVIKSFNGDDKEVISNIVEIESKSARRKAGKGTFIHKKARRFFENLLFEFGEKASVEILFYKKKNKWQPVAYAMGFILDRTYYAFNTAYVDGYQFIAPGKALLVKLLQNLDSSEVNIFDWLRGNNKLKYEFTPFFYHQYSIYVSQNHLVLMWWKIMLAVKGLALKHKNLFYKINKFRYKFKIY